MIYIVTWLNVVEILGKMQPAHGLQFDDLSIQHLVKIHGEVGTIIHVREFLAIFDEFASNL